MDTQVKEALNKVLKALDDIQWSSIDRLQSGNSVPHNVSQAMRSKINQAISAIDHLKTTVKNLSN